MLEKQYCVSSIRLLANIFLIALTIAIIPVAIQAKDDVITIYGTVNSCYHMKNPAVFLKSSPHTAIVVQTKITRTGPDGSFQLHLPKTQFPAGEYYLYFGDQSEAVDNFGSERVVLNSGDIDLDVIGDCDL